jgi:N-glycosylase/DNA lyase
MGNPRGIQETIFKVVDYDLDATLSSGQAFGWQREANGWTGVVAGRAVQLVSVAGGIQARAGGDAGDWSWLRDYLQTEVDLAAILRTFPPDDAHLQRAVRECRGLRLLRQPPWECLAGFILSATKQIVQIQQIHGLLCERYGDQRPLPGGVGSRFGFPEPARVAALSEAQLRRCKMGFRAPYLRAAAGQVTAGATDLEKIRGWDLETARRELLRFEGVGPKIAECVLLFAYGFPTAFPVDVWVRRSLGDHYFNGRAVPVQELARFVAEHFGPHAGYAQQYLFHQARVTGRKMLSARRNEN